MVREEPMVLPVVNILLKSEPEITLPSLEERNCLILSKLDSVRFVVLFEGGLLIKCQRLELLVLQPVCYLLRTLAVRCVVELSVVCISTAENLNGQE